MMAGRNFLATIVAQRPPRNACAWDAMPEAVDAAVGVDEVVTSAPRVTMR